MSADKSKEQHLSETAIVAALYRAVAHKDFADSDIDTDQFAKSFLSFPLGFFCRFKFLRKKIRVKTDELTPGMYEYIIARTAFFDSVFKEALIDGIPQIVLLGGGYDTRAMRFANLNRDTTIFDLDMAETTNRKLKCLNNAKVERPPRVNLISIDFNQDSLLDVLVKNGFKPQEECLFIWEGVSYYLEPASVDATLDFVLNQVTAPSRLAFDYAAALDEDELDNHFGVRKFLETWKEHRAEESFKFTIPEGESEAFLKQRGMKAALHWNSQQIETAFLPKDRGVKLGPVNGLFRFAIAEADS